MKVMLVMPPNWGIDMPALGVAYISAALKRAGHQVLNIDYNIKIWHRVKHRISQQWSMSSFGNWTIEETYRRDIAPEVEPVFEELLEDIEKFQPEAVGFSVFATSVYCVGHVSKLIKARYPHIKIIYGGPNLRDAFYDEAIKFPWVDAAIEREGELPAVDLINEWENPTGRPIPGVKYKNQQGQVVHGPVREMADINSLPIPDFSDLDLSAYTSRTLPFSMSRGCVKRCTFCSEAPFWKKFRMRSADSILQEFKNHKEKYGVTDFLSHDSLMNGEFSILTNLVDMLLKENLQINWRGMCRLDPRMTPELLKRMKEAGCNTVLYGLESGSQRIVNLMAKGFRVENALTIIRDTHEAGMLVCLFIIVGFPKESWVDFFKTAHFIYKIRKYAHLINVSEAGLSPGSPMTLNPKKFGIEGDFAGHWKSKYYGNTIYHRLFKLWLMRKYIDILRIRENKRLAPPDPSLQPIATTLHSLEA